MRAEEFSFEKWKTVSMSHKLFPFVKRNAKKSSFSKKFFVSISKDYCTNDCT